MIRAWATLSVRKDGKLVQMDRDGHPSLEPFLTPNDLKEQFLADQPANDRDHYLEAWSGTLQEQGGYSPEEADAAALALLPDVLSYDRSLPAVYPNGRTPVDETVGSAPGRGIGGIVRQRRRCGDAEKREETRVGRNGKSRRGGQHDPGGGDRDRRGVLGRTLLERAAGGHPAAGAEHSVGTAARRTLGPRQPARREHACQQRGDQEQLQRVHGNRKSTSPSSCRNRARRS